MIGTHPKQQGRIPSDGYKESKYGRGTGASFIPFSCHCPSRWAPDFDIQGICKVGRGKLEQI